MKSIPIYIAPLMMHSNETGERGRWGMNIEFDVKRNSTYLELIITADNVRASSGLLDEKESVEMARELIYAAGKLLPAGYGEPEHRLSRIREDL